MTDPRVPLHYYIPASQLSPIPQMSPYYYIPASQLSPILQMPPSMTFPYMTGPQMVPQPSPYPSMTLALFQMQGMMAAALQRYNVAVMHYAASAMTDVPSEFPIPGPGPYQEVHHPERWGQKTGAPTINPNVHAYQSMATNSDHAITHHKSAGGRKNARRRGLGGRPSEMSTPPHRIHKFKKEEHEKRRHRICDNLRQYVVVNDVSCPWKRWGMAAQPTTNAVASAPAPPLASTPAPASTS